MTAATPSSSTRPLHLLTLTPFYPTQFDDAKGCFVSEPLASLMQLGVASTVLAAQPFYRGREHVSSEAPPAEWVRYGSIPGPWGLASAGAFLFARVISRVRDLHRARPIGLIHAHAPLPCGHAAMLLSRELKVPYVVTVHGLDAYSTNQVPGRAGAWCRRVTRQVYGQAARVLCISEHVREAVLARGPSIRTSVVYNGVDPDRFSPADPATANPPSILSVGNLIPIKGHDTLIRAFATVCPTQPELRLDIVGDGPEQARLTALAQQLGVGERVRFLGRKQRREVAQLYRNCTLFALPSRYEGLGCVYLEAMSSAKVAIACHGQGIDEIIRHGSNGWLVAPDQPQELATGLTTLLSNSTLRDYIGGQARQTILEGLTLSQQAEDLRRIFEECRA